VDRFRRFSIGSQSALSGGNLLYVETGACPVSGSAAMRGNPRQYGDIFRISEVVHFAKTFHRTNGCKSDHMPMVKSISLRNIQGKNSRAAAATAARRGTVERV